MTFSDSPTTRFWTFNIFYWVVFFALSLFVNPLFSVFNTYFNVVIVSVALFWALLLTGCYYVVYNRLGFQNKTYVFTIFQALISAAILILLDLFARYWVSPRLGMFNFFPDTETTYGTNAVSRMARLSDPKNKAADNALQNDLYALFFAINYLTQAFKFFAFFIWIIGFNIYNYSARLRKKEIEKLAVENHAKDLELINLRSQLNPHFLFNALNSIHSLVMTKKETASDAVLLLSDLMRYTLNYEKRNLVPLADEIAVVEKYLQLEKIRFGKKLDAKLDIADDTLDVNIPPIIVQTLVENAIKHGLKSSLTGVLIKINSHLDNDSLTIHIINSGQLTTKDPSVFSTPHNENGQKNGGIGIENTRRRLHMIYGEKAYFELRNLNDTEVIATLKFPKI
jgi:anti-sigma regulatory factor (Ser/Thr protein kinase)